jgi:hypothetical protein
VALVMVVALGAALLVAHLGTVAVDRAAARSAADAAALAGAAEGEVAARWAAGANGGTLERFVWDGAQVEVTVRVGRARASARAVATKGVRPPVTAAVRGDTGGVVAIP